MSIMEYPTVVAEWDVKSEINFSVNDQGVLSDISKNRDENELGLKCHVKLEEDFEQVTADKRGVELHQVAGELTRGGNDSVRNIKIKNENETYMVTDPKFVNQDEFLRKEQIKTESATPDCPGTTNSKSLASLKCVNCDQCFTDHLMYLDHKHLCLAGKDQHSRLEVKAETNELAEPSSKKLYQSSENVKETETLQGIEQVVDLTTGSVNISATGKSIGSPESKTHVCDKCNYSTNRKINLTRHIKVHRHAVDTSSTSTPNDKGLVSIDQESTDNYVCDQCGKSYKTRYGLNLHILSHENKFKHTCSVCHKGYNQKVQFRFHCMSHQKLSASKCSHCKKTFQGHSSLQRHIKLCSLNPETKLEDLHKKFSCDDCALVFATKDRLTSHRNGKHSMPRYTCDNCGKAYGWRSSLQHHKKLCN